MVNDIDTIAQILEHVGFTVTLSKRRSHWHFKSPSGKHFFHSKSSSDWRSVKNFKTELKREGYEIKSLQTQYQQGIIASRAIRMAAQPVEQYEKLIIVKAEVRTVKPRRTNEEIRAHRKEMREMQ